MADIDFSDPLQVIVAFFGIMLTSLVFIMRFLPLILTGGLIGSLFGIFGGGFIWFKIFSEKN